MSKKPDFLQQINQLFGKVIEDTIIKPVRDFLEPGASQQEEPVQGKKEKEKEQEDKPKSLIPQTKAAIFWDYENFPIPKDILPGIFLETLFPAGLDYRYLTKRVYSAPDLIAKHLQVLKNSGFEHKQAMVTGKPNATDFKMTTDCAAYCATLSESALVVIISGDRDFLNLIQILVEQGHDVRLMCQSKKGLSELMHRAVPYIFDRQELLKRSRQLQTSLELFSQLLAYMLANEPDQQLSVQEIFQQIQSQYIKERMHALHGRFELLQQLPEFQWQFQVDNDRIKLLPLPQLPDLDNPISSRLQARQQAVVKRLGNEPDPVVWENMWRELQHYVPNQGDQEKYLKAIYKTCTVLAIRGRLQQKLLALIVTSQDQDLNRLPSSSKTREKIKIKAKTIENILEPIFCADCNKKLNSEQALKQHQQMAHKDLKKTIVHQCPFCPNTFASEQSLTQHQQAKHKPKVKKLPKKFACSVCKKKFTTQEGQKHHQKMVHKQ